MFAAKRLGILVAACLSLPAAGQAVDSAPTPPPGLSELQDLSLKTPGSVPAAALKSINATRAAALREAAIGAGARGGLEARNYEIILVLKKHEAKLDAIYNFRGLMLEANVLPPVLIEGLDLLSQEAGDSIRVVDQVYKIHSQARFATVPPNWREYLYREYPAYAMPHQSLLPQNADEQVAWKAWVAEGWTKGVAQADAIYADSLSRLKRDYEGMVRYRVLQAQGMVSRPFVSQSHFGVTGDSENLNVNEQTLRITAMPGFELEPRNWAAPKTVKEDAATQAPQALLERKPFVEETMRPAISGGNVAKPAPRAKGRT